MYHESDLLPLSALQHLVFCERQCALIHIEQQWSENRFTAEGRVLHERAHEEEREWRGDTLIVRGLRLRSLALGLSGTADVVEFRDGAPDSLVQTPRSRHIPRPGNDLHSFQVRPVEYKRGKPKKDSCDEVQLCAQAMCLEEMLKVTIPVGDLYYGAQRKRYEVVFTDELRNETVELSERLQALFASRITPIAKYEKKCESCSLLDLCMPATTGSGGRVGEYVARWVAAVPDWRLDKGHEIPTAP